MTHETHLPHGWAPLIGTAPLRQAVRKCLKYDTIEQSARAGTDDASVRNSRDKIRPSTLSAQIATAARQNCVISPSS